MTKIPLGSTIAHAYKFAFTRFPAILGSIWLAWSLQQIARWLLRAPLRDFSQAVVARDYALMRGQLGSVLLFFVISIILTAMQVLAVTQLVLNERRGSPYYFFSLGKSLWQLLGAFMLAMISIIALGIAYAMAVFVMAFLVHTVLNAYASPALNSSISMLGTTAAVLVGYGGAIYVITRLFFLLTPLTVAEAKVDLTRVWILTSGNFWRCFLIVLATIIPFMLAEFIVLVIITGPPPLPHGRTPADFQLYQQARLAWELRSRMQSAKLWYVTYPLFAALTALFYGIVCGAEVFAYETRANPAAAD